MGRDDINKQLDYHDYISIHSPRMGRDPSVRRFFQNLGYFNPLSPHGERHTIFQIYQWTNRISIHSPHTGRDFLPFPMLVHRVDFNPLSPHGERPFTLTQPSRSPLISIHSPRMGRDTPDANHIPMRGISIHSPRMGRDGRQPRPGVLG
mgnify:CR=1 FL=1